MTEQTPLRAVGIIRVSSTRGREESIASPDDQRKRFLDECERRGWTPVGSYDEIDVSGGTPLEKRMGLRSAVEDVEQGRADVVVAAYFDRLCRSLRVQDEVVSRVEAGGGQVLAVDFGQVTGGSASQWLSSTVVGAMNEYYRRQVSERVRASHVRAVEAGTPPWAVRPVGYVMLSGQPLELHPIEAPLVRQAFELRADGGSVNDVWRLLTDAGVKRGRTPVANMLKNRLYLGELHFGNLSNLNAHPAIVDADLFRRAQRSGAPRGRRLASDFLLARLQILRCGSCGSTMGGVTHQNASGSKSRLYKCTKSGAADCARQVAILADIVEPVVVDAVKERVAHKRGKASTEAKARRADERAQQTQGNLEAAIRTFAGLEGERAAQERLAEMRMDRDEARDEAERLRGTRASFTIDVATGWERLTAGEQREIIGAVVKTVLVFPGRGADRIAVEFIE